MRIVIDIDGTICELRRMGQTYSDVRINPLAREKMHALRKAGHYLILHTARHMRSCNGDVGLVKDRIGSITEEWLRVHDIPYDELHYGKPYADVYIDDLSHPFSGWDALDTAHFDDSSVNILLPMAGRGSRFKERGYTLPKPLIDVCGHPMIDWALRSFDFLDELPSYRIVMIIQQQDEHEHHLGTTLTKLFSDKYPLEIIEIPEQTDGQARTCLSAKRFIENHQKLFIFNCDTYSTAPIWKLVQEENPDGIIPYFKATDSRYSFIRFDENGYVVETAEKRPISSNASNGMYYFKRGLDFVQNAEKMISKKITHNGEFYVAPVYNELYLLGKRIRGVETTKYHVLGTPEERERFIHNNNAQELS